MNNLRGRVIQDLQYSFDSIEVNDKAEGEVRTHHII